MTIIKDGINCSAFEVPHNSGSYMLTVKVDDNKVAEQVPGFDRMEKVFALVPDSNGQWKRINLGYSRTEKGIDYHVADTHLDASGGEVVASDGTRLEGMGSVLWKGVAFGMDTNVGTVWFQGPGENKPWSH